MLTRFILPFGRLPRLHFWRDVAIVGIAVELAFLADGIVGVFYAFSALAVGLVAFVVIGLGACSILVLAAQRLHDRDSSGWWVLIALLPILGQVWLVWNGSAPGTAGPNRYGPDVRSGMSLAAAVFGDGPTPAIGRRPPVASTATGWTIFVGLLAIGIWGLFQSPAPPAASHAPDRERATSRDTDDR